MKKVIEIILFFIVGFCIIYGLTCLLRYSFLNWDFYVSCIFGFTTFFLTIKFLDQLAEKVDSYLDTNEDDIQK